MSAGTVYRGTILGLALITALWDDRRRQKEAMQMMLKNKNNNNTDNSKHQKTIPSSSSSNEHPEIISESKNFKNNSPEQEAEGDELMYNLLEYENTIQDDQVYKYIQEFDTTDEKEQESSTWLDEMFDNNNCDSTNYEIETME